MLSTQWTGEGSPPFSQSHVLTASLLLPVDAGIDVTTAQKFLQAKAVFAGVSVCEISLRAVSSEETFEYFETFAPDTEPASKILSKDLAAPAETFEETFVFELTFEPKHSKVSKVFF